jgi:hypothetical protein
MAGAAAALRPRTAVGARMRLCRRGNVQYHEGTSYVRAGGMRMRA